MVANDSTALIGAVLHPMITHDEAMAILWQHGELIGWTPTAWYSETGLLCETSSFYWEHGVKTHYPRRDVFWWLGY